MIFIIPIILGAVALITAGVGVTAGANGVSKMDEAKKIAKAAQRRYEQEQKSVERAFQVTQQWAEEYGQLQIQVKIETMGRLVAFIERIGQRASQKDLEFLEGLEGVSPHQIQEYKISALEAQNFVNGGFKALGSAAAASQGTVALVGLFGTASTGTAIGGLGGAAAWNATLAWLGGGSLATGGGGMALGSIVLGGIEKALTKARLYNAKANTEIAKLDAFEDLLGQVQTRIRELTDIVKTLNNKAIDGLVELESTPFVSDRDAVKFQQVIFLIKALDEIIRISVLDAKGNLNQNTATLKAKYRNI